MNLKNSHTYKKKGDGHPSISSVNIKTPLSLYLFLINNHIAGFTKEGSMSITIIALYSDTSPTSAKREKTNNIIVSTEVRTLGVRSLLLKWKSFLANRNLIVNKVCQNCCFGTFYHKND